MPSGIYKIVNTETNKVYVGSAVNFKKRWAAHLSLLARGKHHSIYLQRSWNNHKKEVFKFKVLELVPNLDTLLLKEQYWLDKYRSYNLKFGYNLCNTAGSTLGFKHSEKTKKLYSKLHKGKKFADKHKKKISKALKHYKRTTQHNSHISDALKGKLVGEKNPFYGKHHTDAMKRRRREQELGKKWSKKRKEKRQGSGNPFFGKKHTEEAWAKTRAGYWLHVEEQRRLKELAKIEGGIPNV